MIVMAIGAHPDDVEFYCGGTLLQAAEAGCEVYSVVATDGCMGKALTGLGPEALSKVRFKEVMAAEEIMEWKSIWMGFRDGRLAVEAAVFDAALRELIRKIKPDVILSHDPDDYHPDHRTIARTVQNLSDSAEFADIPVYFTDTCAGKGYLSGHPFNPEWLVDVSQVNARRVEALKKHASQVNEDILGMLTAQGRFRGIQISLTGVECAEAFRSGNVPARQKGWFLPNKAVVAQGDRLL